jgi:chromate transporter
MSQSGAFGRFVEVAVAFFKLGLTSFGGPIAHVGYFQREFVARRRWIDGERFGHLLALCQSLPGPASSQLGFSLGLLRAGWPGAVAAFIGFTLPSALLMFAFASSSHYLEGQYGQALAHGLKLVAVAVVAQGVLAMARTLTPDVPRALMATTAGAIVLLVNGNSWTQLLVIAGGAGLGPLLCRQAKRSPGYRLNLPYGRRGGSLLLTAFCALLTLAFAARYTDSPMGQAAGAFYRVGALVFGGGHVVLPLLKQAVVSPGWIDDGTFLAGYGAAQAMPGPLFSIAAFLGNQLQGGRGGALGAVVAVLAIFLPGLLLASGVLPFWQALSTRDLTARMLAGINAVVVGLLASALYDPLWVSAVRDHQDFAIALVGFVLLVAARAPSWVAVCWCVLATLLRVAWQ